MKKIVISIFVLFAVVGVYGIATSKDSPTEPAKTFSSIQSDVDSGAKLYDVRTATEYKSGHFEGALNFSLQDMQAGRLPNVAKDHKIYVHCQSGNRSSQAVTTLKNAGFTNVTDLGGVQDVQLIGGKII